jgi:hypothetical protein
VKPDLVAVTFLPSGTMPAESPIVAAMAAPQNDRRIAGPILAVTAVVAAPRVAQAFCASRLFGILIACTLENGGLLSGARVENGHTA